MKQDGYWENKFYTVFPNNVTYLPQDFGSYEEAVEYAEENFGTGNYTIETPC